MPILRKRTVGREPKKIPLSLFILERVLNQVVKLGVLSYVLAWLLARTSTQAVVNLPLAVCVVIFARWLSLRLVVATSATGSGSSRRMDRYVVLPSLYRESPARSGDKSDREAWRKIVNAPIVAGAWESFCGSILQEWVYDSWLSLVTPDREFPAEVRRLLNEIFAEVTQRARRIDLRTVLIRDVCDLFSEQLEIFRATKESVGIRNKGDLKPSSIDRAFQQEMKTEGTLHVAFCTRDGHYRVVRRIAEGVISVVMSRDDLSRPYVKSLVRELFATCVLRPLLMFFTPYNANRLILSAFPEELGPKASELNQPSNTERQNGHFQFEQRVRKSAALEARAVKRTQERMALQKAAQTQTPLVKEGSFPAQRLRQRHPDDVASVDDSAMGKELEHSDTRRVLRRMRSKSFDDVSALVREGRVPRNPLDQGRLLTNEGASVVSEPLEAVAIIEGSGAGSPVRKWRGASDASGSSPSRSVRSPFSCQQPRLGEVSFPNELDFKAGFKGHPRARVGVHEMVYDDGGRKRYVVFKIRVADDTGEWTVARRYRNFEALHKSLRDHPVYQELGLKLPPKRFLLHSQNTEFVEERRTALNGYLQALLKDKALAFNPDVWAFLCDPNNQTYKHDVEVSLLRTITDNVDTAKHRVKRAVGYRGKQEHQGHHQATDSDVHSSRGSLQTPRDIYEPPEGSVSGTSTNGLIGTAPPARFNSVHSELSNPLRTADPRKTMGSGRVNTALMGIGTPSSSGQVPMSELQTMHQSWLDGSISRPESPVRSVRNLDAKSMSDSRSVGESSDTPMKANNGREEIGRESFAWNSLPVMKPEASWPNWDAEFEDYSGISGPLYEVVDAVFDLPGRNMFRKQVLQGVRQLLSLLAGASIDLFLLEKIKSLRTEHTIARIIHSIKNSLWPGGKWFSTVPPYSVAKENYQKANPGARKGMQRDRYLEPLWGPEDAIDIAERVHHRVFAQAPPTLVRIVGKGLYTSGMQDVYDMLQSPTFVMQIGYGVVEVVLLALFPELRDMFARMHREAAQVHHESG
ncbi:hypothetical protein BSKO_07182 [Bryopsis sp. KO-2023]|nr:hypothetical protein BSKO_07182 [Bryopsis sp. KO-2023]